MVKPIVVTYVAWQTGQWAYDQIAIFDSGLSCLASPANPVVTGLTSGAVGGFSAGLTGALLYGGNVGQALSYGVKGAITGGVMGFVSGATASWNVAERVIASATASGYTSKSLGGSFHDGFRMSLILSTIQVGYEFAKESTDQLKQLACSQLTLPQY